MYPLWNSRLSYGQCLVHFAENPRYIAFCPTSSFISKFVYDPGKWNHSKDATQFLYKKGLPKRLIRSIARMRRVKRELVKEMQA